MGIRDRMAEAREQAEEAPPLKRYETEVNKGSTNMKALTTKLNVRWHNGWRLHTMLEQDGNTVMVFERRDDA